MQEALVRFIAALRKRAQDGQGLVEYALILVLVSIVCLAALTFLGQQVNIVFNNIGVVLNAAVP